MRVRQSITRTFLKGAAVLLPIAIIVLVVYWTAYTLEVTLGNWLRFFLPERLYFPGLGILFGGLLTYAVGVSLSTETIQIAFGRVERFLQSIPLIKTLYGSVQDMVEMFSADKKRRFNRVVQVMVGNPPLRLVGFVTRETLEDIPLPDHPEDLVAVYLPMSYQVGGYFVMVPKTAVTPMPMSIEDATRMIFTAGISVRHQDAPKASVAPPV